MKVLSAEDFAMLSPYGKGYAVYMFGSREDQPNVPEEYEPSEEDKAEFDRGQFQAVLDVQDSEE